MYDSFDMACHDEDTALRLNIKVNSENLLPTPQKYNLGSLRLPADPSWPKIPQRRLADDIGDLIQPPCIVTLTGTPKRSRTIVRVPQSQSCKLGGSKDLGNFTTHHYCGKAQHLQNQLPKRRSGCTDPRFKKVTTLKSQMTSTDPAEYEIDKQTEINCSVSEVCEPAEDKLFPWKNTTRAQVIQQEAEKPDETKGTESVGIQTVQTISSEITSDMNEPKTNSFRESNEQNSAEFRRKSSSPVTSARKQLKPETPRPTPTLQNKTPRNLENNVSFKNDHSHQSTNLKNQSNGSPDAITQIPSMQCCQGKEGQFFSIDERKLQGKDNMPIENPLDLTPEPNNQCPKQGYNIPVPVMSYQNVPVQISTEEETRVDITPRFSDSPIPNFGSSTLFKNIEIPKLELSNDAVPKFLNFGNTECKPFSSQQMENLGFHLKLDPVGQTTQTGSQKKLNTQLPRDRKYQSSEVCKNDTISPQLETKFKYISNESNILPKPQINENHRLQFESTSEKLMKNIHNEERCRPQQNVPSIFVDSVPKHNFHIYCHKDNPFQSCCRNIPQKLSDVQSLQYHTVTAGSESETHGNLINQDRSSNDRQEQLTKNRYFICGRQRIADSESASAGMSCTKQNNYFHLSEKLNGSFFVRTDDHDDKKFQPLNHEGAYFEENESRDRSLHSKYKTVLNHEQSKTTRFRQKRKMRSEQHLMLNKTRVQSSEPQIASSRRRSRTPYLKKANSYLSKYADHLTTNSESTYLCQNHQHTRNENKMATEGNDLMPNSEHAIQANYINFMDCKKTNIEVIPHPTDLNDVKRQHCIKPYQRPSHKSAKLSTSLDLQRQNFSSHKSPRAKTDITLEKPTAIPVKTQQLLNKSYWEYYNKLKLHRMENGESPQQQYFCQVAMGAPQSKKRRTPELILEESNNTTQIGDRMELSLPEIRTLEQCSVLSTMINKTLDSALQPSSETIRTKQIYLNGNMRSSSDPTAGTQSAILKKLFPGDNEDSIVSSTLMYNQKHKRDKHFNNKTLKLKSIGEHPVVFFGCMVYAMIVFLPMIYDYFSYEEHDEYEDLSYIGTAYEYIIASFGEAFGEFFDMMNKIFFKPRSCRKCNNLT